MLGDLIEEFEMMDQVVVHSGKDAIKGIKERFPEIMTFFGQEDAYKLFGSFVLGLLPYVEFEGDMVALPFLSKDFLDWETSEPYVINSAFKIYVMHFFRVFFAPITTNLKKRGYPSMPWVVNTTEDLEAVRLGGAIGAVSDHPDLAKQYIGAHDLRCK